MRDKAILVSSMLLYILDNHLSPEDKTKGSVINMKQQLLGKLRSTKRLDLVKKSNEIWQKTIDEHKHKRIYVSDFIESILMENYYFLVEEYGKQQMYRFVTAAQKLLEVGIDKEVLKESREIVQFITKEIENAVQS